MKKAFKTITAWILGFCILLASPMTAQGTAVTQEDLEKAISDLTSQLISIINDMNRDLQNQINNIGSGQPPPPTPTPVYAPKIQLLSPQTVTLGPGETLDVELQIKNIGTSSANNLLTQLSSDANNPFSAEFLNNSNNINAVKENQTQTIRLRITADAGAAPRTYVIGLNHSYKNQASENLSSSDNLTVRIAGEAVAPNVMISGFRASQSILEPGGSFGLSALIENKGSGSARDVRITIEGLDAEGIYLTSDLNSAYFNTLRAGYSGGLGFDFAVSDKTRGGTYPLTFKLSYKDEGKEAFEDSFTHFVNVLVPAETGERPVVEIRNLTSPSGTVDVDRRVSFTMEIFNSGAAEAKKIEIKAAPVTSGEEIVLWSTNPQIMNHLAPDAGKTVTFSVSPTDTSRSRSYTVSFQVTYEDEAGESYSFTQNASINVNNPEKEKDPDLPGRISKPRMIVSAYTIDPQIARAGETFFLSLTFQNASGEKAVKNVKITLESVEPPTQKGSVFSPASGSNTFYIDTIEPKGEVTQSLTMYTVPDADPRSYRINVDFKYQDEDNNDYNESEQLSINVKQTTRLEITEPYFPDYITAGQSVYLWFSVINSGRVTLANVRIKFEGDFDTSQADMFIGNIGRGNSISYDGQLTPLNPGTQEGAIVVYGEDDTGDIVEYRHSFTLNVSENMGEGGFFPGEDRWDMGGGETNIQEEESGLLNKIWNFAKKPYVWGPAAGLAVIIIIVVIVLARRKKSRIDFDE